MKVFIYFHYINHAESFTSHSNQLILECRARCLQYKSSSSIKWFKNGILIEHVPNRKYTATQKNGFIRLSIASPNEPDSGEYSCEIELPDQTVQKVLHNVNINPPIVEERQKCRKYQKHVVQKQILHENGEHGKHLAPVALTSFMKNLTIEEGNRAKFVCSVFGQVDTVEWFRDNILLQPKMDRRYRFINTDAITGLEIQHVIPNDSGFYTCTIYGQRNSVTSSSELTVYEAYKSPKKSFLPKPSSLSEFISKGKHSPFTNYNNLNH